jgi:hypothetical protein
MEVVMRSFAALVVLGMISGCASAGGVEPVPSVPEGTTLVLRADRAVADVADRVHVEVVREGRLSTWDVPLRAGEPGAMRFPVEVTLDAEASAPGDVTIVAEVLDAARSVAARQRLRTVIPAVGLDELVVTFTGDCVLELCGDATTCRDGTCIEACVDALGAPMSCDELPAPPVEDPTSCDDAHAGALFCDGFEATLPGAWSIVHGTDDGTQARVSDPVHRGEGALAVSTTGTGDVSSHVGTTFAPPSSELSVRFYAYVPSSAALDETNLAFAGGTHDTALVGLELGIDGDDAYARWYPSTLAARQPFPRDRWVCLEGHATSGAAGSVELSIEGVPVQQAVSDVVFPDGDMVAYVGLALARRATGPITVYVDDVVIDGPRVGCD